MESSGLEVETKGVHNQLMWQLETMKRQKWYKLIPKIRELSFYLLVKTEDQIYFTQYQVNRQNIGGDLIILKAKFALGSSKLQRWEVNDYVSRKYY